MDIDNIKRLLDAYFDATATAGQESELRRLLTGCDLTALPGEVATDARLARTLLGMAPPTAVMPEGFAATLGRQVDRLERAGRMKRRRLGWGIAAGVAVAASLALLLMPSGSLQTVVAPSAQAPVMAQATQSVQTASAVEKEKTPVRQLAQAVSPKSVAPKKAAEAAPAEIDAEPERTVEFVDGVLVVTEYYDPDDAGRLTATADIPVDAPIYISYVDGEGQTYQSLDQSADAMAMLEEAFGLIAGTRREAVDALGESKKLVTNAIEELDENRK